MSRVVFSVGFNSDNPDEARIIEALANSQAAHGRAGVKTIMVAAFNALLAQNSDARRVLDRQDEILRILDRLQRSGIAVGGDTETPAGVGGIDAEVARNMLGAFKPGRKR